MKKKTILCLAVLIVLSLCFTACGSTPSDVVRTYMNAFSKGDINGMLDCIEPDSAALIEGATGIAASQFGLDSATLMGMSPGLMSIMNAYGYGYSVDYTIVGETVHGDTATVTVDFELSADGETMMSDENAEVALVKTDGRWYIALS